MLLANVFKLRCTVVTQECAVSRFRVATFSRSYVPIYPHVPEVFSQFKCDARLNYVPYSMKGEVRFFGVSSLSHSFARALPYSRFRKSVLFLAVSQERSLSHDFARALPYSAFYGKEESRFFELVLVQRS